jgi:hypothetical protein
MIALNAAQLTLPAQVSFHENGRTFGAFPAFLQGSRDN